MISLSNYQNLCKKMKLFLVMPTAHRTEYLIKRKRRRKSGKCVVDIKVVIVEYKDGGAMVIQTLV